MKQALGLEGPVLLLDVGDNVGGGSPADGTLLAHALHVARVRSFVCLYDPLAVERCVEAGAGTSIELEVGGKTDGLHGKQRPPLSTDDPRCAARRAAG